MLLANYETTTGEHLCLELLCLTDLNNLFYLAKNTKSNEYLRIYKYDPRLTNVRSNDKSSLPTNLQCDKSSPSSNPS